MAGDRIRLRYKKIGKAGYISHLDMMAVIRRALLRAGLELEYSEGFNPHPYISVAIPAPVGVESECELADVDLAVNVQASLIPGMLAPVLPEGVEALEAYAPGRKFGEIAWMRLRGRLLYDREAPYGAEQRLTERIAAGGLIAGKKTKRGEERIDVAPFLRDVTFHAGGKADMIAGTGSNAGGIVSAPSNDYAEVEIQATVSAQNPSVSPSLLVGALSSGDVSLKPVFSKFTRTEFFDREFSPFR